MLHFFSRKQKSVPDVADGAGSITRPGKFGRSRRRRILEWAGATLAVLVLLASVACSFWESVVFRYIGTIGKSPVHLRATIRGGSLHLRWGLRAEADRLSGVLVGRRMSDLSRLVDLWYEVGFWPRYEFSMQWILRNGYVSVPMWMLTVPIGIVAALVRRGDRRSARLARCLPVRDDGGDDVSGTCPRCGSASE